MSEQTGERARPRITGERGDEVLDVTLRLLAEVGYDRLTMDAVAAEARAGKASLYRRWRSKSDLVVDAIDRADRCAGGAADIDTGSLRGDLLASACGDSGLTDVRMVALMTGLMTAVQHDEDLRLALQTRFVAPRAEASRRLLERGQRRGEVRPDADLDLLTDVLPSMVVLQVLIHGRPLDTTLITRVVDEVVLPAVRCTPPDDG
ncbi:MAG TPA: TetR/AcrR family transcriptional regulator [Actinomycetales bacterium]|jgi:AcrR family transcriptional regulator